MWFFSCIAGSKPEESEGMSDYAQLASEADRLRSLVEQLTLSRYHSLEGWYPEISYYFSSVPEVIIFY
jgi:hypothetical protein